MKFEEVIKTISSKKGKTFHMGEARWNFMHDNPE